MGIAESLLRGWLLVPVAGVSLLAATAGYVVAATRLDRRHPTQPWPRQHTVCFLAGMTAMAVAILGPPAYFDDVFFYAHMTQHILLTMVGPPLIVLGEPILLILRTTPRGARNRWLVPFLRSRAVTWLLSPPIGWLLFVGVMLASHAPALYDYALQHPLVHDYVEHALYVTTAFLFFYPLLSTTPGARAVRYWVRGLSLFTMMVPTALLGFFIYVAPRLEYPFYARVDRPFGPAALPDQQLGGALMWSTAMALGAVWFCVVGVRWLRAEERRSHSVDRAVARAVTAAHETYGSGSTP